MILEQLQTIKKFGCTKESDVTMEDIQKKNRSWESISQLR